MKYFVKLFLAATLVFLFSHFAKSQSKKSTVSVKAHTNAEKGFGNPQSISDVKDVLENKEAYNALKDLIENHHVTMKMNPFVGIVQIPGLFCFLAK